VISDGSVNWRETSWPDSPNQAPPTFLLQLVALLNKRIGTATGRYVYNEQEYLLTLERQQPVRSREQDSQPPHESRNEFPPRGTPGESDSRGVQRIPPYEAPQYRGLRRSG
jgi:hypothetical protein